MAFGFTIDFPMGFYQGRDLNGEPEAYPTVNRLYSALIAAAFAVDCAPAPLDRVLGALTWLEGNPPDAVLLPEARVSWRQGAIAYRNVGRFGRGSTAKSMAPSSPDAELASRISSVSGPVEFWWKGEPEPAEAEIISILAGEIPYVGERPSVAKVQVEHRKELPIDAYPVSLNQLLPDNQAVRIEYPEIGRLKELVRAHDLRNGPKAPTLSQDRPKANEEERLFLPPRSCVGLARYRLPTPSVSDAPWTSGFLVEISGYVSPDGKGPVAADLSPEGLLGWSVALHRAIVKQIGWGAPAVVTGKYAEGIEQPANHMAIQILPPGIRPQGSPSSTGFAFAVVLPGEATADDRRQVHQALRQITSLYRGIHGKLLIRGVETIDPSRFWATPPPGYEYWWEPTPAAIVEVRGGQKGPHGNQWTVDDALKLGVGFVWRDRFETGGRGLSLYHRLILSVEAAGVKVRSAHKVPLRPAGDYIHRRNNAGSVSGVTGQIFLEPLGTASALIAIGQTRHLGGGLLLPVLRPTRSWAMGEESDA